MPRRRDHRLGGHSGYHRHRVRDPDRQPGYPNKLVFDETYYAKDAYSLLQFGYERNWPTDANAKIIAGNLDAMQDTASFIVHPPVGKWLIAAGEQLFGMNSFGWRFGAAGLRHAVDLRHDPAGPPGLPVDLDRRPGRAAARPSTAWPS